MIFGFSVGGVGLWSTPVYRCYRGRLSIFNGTGGQWGSGKQTPPREFL